MSDEPTRPGECPSGCCWHATEGSTTYRMGDETSGTTHESCCMCGKHVARKWRGEMRPMPGHGPHAPRVMVRVYEAPN